MPQIMDFPLGKNKENQHEETQDELLGKSTRLLGVQCVSASTPVDDDRLGSNNHLCEGKRPWLNYQPYGIATCYLSIILRYVESPHVVVHVVWQKKGQTPPFCSHQSSLNTFVFLHPNLPTLPVPAPIRKRQPQVLSEEEEMSAQEPEEQTHCTSILRFLPWDDPQM